MNKSQSQLETFFSSLDPENKKLFTAVLRFEPTHAKNFLESMYLCPVSNQHYAETNKHKIFVAMLVATTQPGSLSELLLDSSVEDVVLDDVLQMCTLVPNLVGTCRVAKKSGHKFLCFTLPR